MSIALLELGASALGDLVREVVFTGGATVGLWITDPAAPEPRPTEDVDVIVEVTSRGRFADFEQRLRRRRFREDQESGIVCRWRHADSDRVLDAMPMEGSILGFENRWQGPAVPYAIQRELPSGTGIAAVSPPFLVATELEAFASRGRGDYIARRDFAHEAPGSSTALSIGVPYRLVRDNSCPANPGRGSFRDPNEMH